MQMCRLCVQREKKARENKGAVAGAEGVACRAESPVKHRAPATKQGEHQGRGKKGSRGTRPCAETTWSFLAPAGVSHKSNGDPENSALRLGKGLEERHMAA